MAFLLLLSPEISIAQVNGDSEELASQVAELKRNLLASERQLSENEWNLESTERRIASIRARVNELAEQEIRVRAELEGLNDKQQSHAQHLPRLKQQIERVLNVQYRLQRESQLKIVLSQNDPVKVQRILKYYEYMIRAESDKLARLTEELNEIESTRFNLKKRQREIETVRLELLEHEQELAGQLSRRAQEISKLKQRVADAKTALEEKIARQRQLKHLVGGLQNLPDPGVEDVRLKLVGLESRKGDMPMPVKGEIRTRYRQPDARSGVESNGIVIAETLGADVRSISDGRVVYSDWFRGYGLLLVLDHGKGFMSLYGYNSELLHQVGALVSENTVISRVGDTSGRAQSELYFEIRKDGKPVNPEVWCRN